MPKQTPSQFSEPKPLSVEQLLRLKQAEKPSQEFWADFDRQLQQRMLQSLVEERPSATRRVFAALARGRHFAIPAFAAMLVMVGVSLQYRGGSVSPQTQIAAANIADEAGPMHLVVAVEAPARRAPVARNSNERFVLDSLRLDDDSSGFKKVMASEVFTLGSTASTHYVADPMSGPASRFLSGASTY